ncbi:MAG: nucleotidyltransferase family protein [Clostridia bacterium]|nr:nucleotidyltransferase family protein [Clostridia bacterium]
MKFNTIGIICEYNPFHFGHKYHINEARKISGCKNVVCIMSGSMVQRGEPAVFDKWSRAKTAIENGADLVIELPACYALQSADNFAFGAVSVLDRLGVIDALCFGAETDDISSLEAAAKITAASPEEYNEAIRERLAMGEGYPGACEYALTKLIPDVNKDVFSPNSTLAIAYISSVLKLNSKIKPFCIKRNNDYHSDKSDDDFQSATSIRKMIANGEDYTAFAPDYSALRTYNLKNAETFILGFFRNCLTDSLKTVVGYENGLENLVINSAKRACTLEEFFSLCTTKRYTLHRIKRFCMCAILGIKKNLAPVDYVRVLAFNSVGASIIREIKEKSSLIPVTKAADYCGGSEAFSIDVAATDFASLCCDDTSGRTCGKDFLCSPYVLKNI